MAQFDLQATDINRHHQKKRKKIMKEEKKKKHSKDHKSKQPDVIWHMSYREIQGKSVRARERERERERIRTDTQTPRCAREIWRYICVRTPALGPAAEVTTRDNPKSNILTQFVAMSTEMFDGFKSRCMMP